MPDVEALVAGDIKIKKPGTYNLGASMPGHRDRSYDRVHDFKKKWGIDKTELEINGLTFYIEFDTAHNNDDKVTAWISTDEQLPAEEIILFLVKSGMLSIKEKDQCAIKWVNRLG
jgi:hypothetical protein